MVSNAPPIAVHALTRAPVLHPAGNVAEFLVGAGLARVVGWHNGLLAPYGGLERIRAAEKSAKEKRLCMYANAPATASTAKSGATQTNGGPKVFDGTVIRVWSGDQVSILPRSGGKERRIQFSSTRAPKCASSSDCMINPFDILL